jgi:hypothetical protein
VLDELNKPTWYPNLSSLWTVVVRGHKIARTDAVEL